MSYTEKESAEAMESFDTLTIPEAANFVLNTPSLEDLSNLSQGEIFLSTEMDTSTSEVLHTSQDEHVEEEYVQDDLGAHEVEIETIEGEVMGQMVEETVVSEAKIVKSAVPPLRPLTIAPKPTKAIPLQIKQGGTQLLLVQGGTVGQPIKFLSQSGQELNLSNVSMAKPITIKPTIKGTTNNISVLQPKQVLMKKVITQVPSKTTKTIDGKQSHVLVMQKSDTQQVKLIQNSSSVLSGTTKTLTLSQAQQMGYLSGAKIVPQVAGAKQTFVVNKNPTKSIKLVPQKSPTKILPAPQAGTSTKMPQRIFLKPSNANQILSTSQLIQVSGTQSLGSAGQLHQINIPGKGVQFIKFIQSPQTETSSTSASGITTIKTQTSPITNKIIPVSTISSSTKPTIGVTVSDVKKLTKSNLIAPKPTKVTSTLAGSSGSQMLVVPTNYTSPSVNTTKVAIPVRTLKPSTAINESPIHAEPSTMESNGMRPRKPCNCTKSQCLKLYCDCFANGEFCYMCNCVNCFNNLENEEHRQRAIKNCLERNPNAFRPKIGKAKDTTGDTPVRKHTKGCNCKRSGCLKNYCECYEAKIACSSNCKCIGCRNVEDTSEKKNIKPSVDSGNLNSQPLPSLNFGTEPFVQVRPKKASNSKQAFNYITIPVIEASTTCLLALCNNDEEEDEEECTKKIIEEFGRCLEDIIQCSLKSSNIKMEI